MILTTLLVEDDPGLQGALAQSFRKRGHEVLTASKGSEALSQLRERRVDLLLLDLHLPDVSGLEVLSSAREIDEGILVLVMTAFPDVTLAIQAMKAGAYDFIVKPFELDELHLAVERGLGTRELRREVRRLRHAGAPPGAPLLGESPPMVQLRERIREVAEADIPVLLLGRTGTGKELVANALHAQSGRSGGPLVKVNCSAFSEALLEDELFGHEKGAFTDARESREGLFELADGGTLFLDEISEMKPALQAKLLRLLDGQPFRRVGGRREIRSDVRIVAATNRDLPERIRTGDFREDLYFRLNGFRIEVPPLHARGGDILLLARHFLGAASSSLRKEGLRLASATEEVLAGYGWPGNVRELRNVMEHAAIRCEAGEVQPFHLPAEIQLEGFLGRGKPGTGPMPPLREVERRYIEHIVGAVGGNLSEAARILGIARNTLKGKRRTP